MDANERLEVFVDEVVSGLKGDPELMLDARAELLSHLDEVMELQRGAGHAEDEAAEHAMKAFGPATDTAGDLVNANARRMRWRAYARRSLQLLVVPLAVFVAVATLVGMLQRDPRCLLSGVGSSRSFDSYLSQEAYAIVQGNVTHGNDIEALRAYWLANPERKALLARYIFWLRWDIKSAQDLKAFESEVRLAEKADPDNGLYGLLLADAFCQQACRIQKSWNESGAERERGDHPRYTLEVFNRGLLDKAMAELLGALRKPYTRDYADDSLREMLGVFPEARRLEGTMRNLIFVAGERLTTGFYHTTVAQVAALYAGILMEEGEKRQAETYLEAWRILALRYVENGSFVDDVAMTGHGAGRAGETAAQVYERFGKLDDAQRDREDARLLGGVSAARYASHVDVPEHLSYLRMDPDWHRTLPAVTDLGPMHWDAIDLSLTRAQEYLAGEQFVFSILAVVLFILLVDCAYVAFHWRYARGVASAPFLLVPPWRKVLQTIGVSIGVPGAIYLAFTRLTPWAQRDWALRANISVSVLATAFLGVAVVVVSYWTASGHIRGRCQALQVPIPPRRLPRLRAGTSLAMLLVVLVAGLVCAFAPLPNVGLAWPLLYALVLVMVFLGIVQARVIGHSLSAPEEYGLYYGTVARSLIPYFALAIITLGGIVQPALRAREAHLFERDPVMQIDPELPGLYREEHELVERLKRDLLAELEWDEKKSAVEKADAASPDAPDSVSVEHAVGAHEGVGSPRGSVRQAGGRTGPDGEMASRSEPPDAPRLSPTGPGHSAPSGSAQTPSAAW